MKALRVIYPALAAVLAAGLATIAVAQTAPAKPAAAPAAPKTPAAAEAPKAPEPPVPTLVAVIPFQQAAFQTEEGKGILAELKKKFEPKQQTLKAAADEIAGLEKQLNDPASKLTDAEKAERKKTIEAKKKQLQHEAQQLEAEWEKDFDAAWKPLAEKFYKSLVAEAQGRGVGLVIDAGSEQHPIIWGSDQLKPLNLSLDAIERYNKTPAAPAAAPAPGAATK